MTPATASLLSLLVPGSAHFALGQPVRGALAVATCFGLFWLGAASLWDRTFHFVLVDADMLAALPLNLLPEFFNFANAEILRLAVDSSSEAAKRALREPREGEHLLAMASGLSGWLSVCWAADAWWFARQKASGESASPAPGSRVLPGTAVMATFLCPGLGQYLAGHRSKGIVVGVAVWILFLGGILFAHGHAVDRPLAPAWWIAQSLCGGGAALAAVTSGPLQMDGSPHYLNLGIVLAACAGLVNVSGMLDAWRIAGGRWGGQPGGGPSKV